MMPLHPEYANKYFLIENLNLQQISWTSFHLFSNYWQNPQNKKNVRLLSSHFHTRFTILIFSWTSTQSATITQHKLSNTNSANALAQQNQICLWQLNPVATNSSKIFSPKSNPIAKHNGNFIDTLRHRKTRAAIQNQIMNLQQINDHWNTHNTNALVI